MQKIKMNKEEFKAFAKEVKPVIKNMEDILKKYGIECLVSLTMSTDGYFNFSIHDFEWEFKRLDSDAKSVISMHVIEEV